jgi:nucleoid-associated protein YgaU
MSDNVGRIFGAIGALAALWIVVYWWWEPSHRISMDATAPSSAGAAVVDPGSTPRVVEPRPEPPVIHPAAVSTPPASNGRPIAVIPPKFRDYTIQRGDTMESIAQKELGSRKLADALRTANALMDPDHLKPGRTMRIPLDPTNIQGKPVLAESPQTSTATAASASTETTEYTVKSGDTLSGIAKAKYGSTKFKDFLYEANKDRLPDEDGLREGQKLRIPPKPAP